MQQAVITENVLINYINQPFKSKLMKLSIKHFAAFAVIMIAMLCLVVGCHAQNLVLNGGFENTAADSLTFYPNLNNGQFNSKMKDCNAIGTAGQIDIVPYYGYGYFPPSSGHCIALDVSQDASKYDALTMKLWQCVQSGKDYFLECWCSGEVNTANHATPLTFGISTTNNSLGTTVATFPAPPNYLWTRYFAIVTAPNNGQYLTIKASGLMYERWTAIDSITLTELTSLPITLLYFNGHAEQAANVLQWKTAQEINNDYFILYKGADLKAMMPLAKVYPLADHYYSVIDVSPFDISYYTLRQVGYDAEVDSCGTVAVQNIKKKKTINITTGQEERLWKSHL